MDFFLNLFSNFKKVLNDLLSIFAYSYIVQYLDLAPIFNCSIWICNLWSGQLLQNLFQFLTTMMFLPFLNVEGGEVGQPTQRVRVESLQVRQVVNVEALQQKQALKTLLGQHPKQLLHFRN